MSEPPSTFKVVLDTGASLHIVKRRKGGKVIKGKMVRIMTASGIVSSSLYHVFYVPSVGELNGLILEET